MNIQDSKSDLEAKLEASEALGKSQGLEIITMADKLNGKDTAIEGLTKQLNSLTRENTRVKEMLGELKKKFINESNFQHKFAAQKVGG